jgi:hypothetical protein
VVALAALLAVLAVLSPLDRSWAQMQAAKASATRVSGRVEVLHPGQTQWVPLAPNATLAEGAQVRAFAGASAELAMPDGSTIIVAENTRFALVKLEVDRQTSTRNILTHLIVGKVLAEVRQLAAQLVQARQSNFAISTPAGVAAVRGTRVVLTYDTATNTGVLFVLPSPGQPAALASATYVDFGTRTARVVGGGSFVTHVAGRPPSVPAPVSALPASVQQQIQATTNQATANAPALTQLVVVIPPAAVIQQALVQLATAPAAPPAAPPPAPTPPPQPLSPPTPTTAQPVSGQ